MNKKLFTAVLSLACLCGSAGAQEATEYVFSPAWYVQGQIGMQETLGETSFGKLAAPNAQVAVGYQFNPVFGLRLAVNGWQSKASCEFQDATYRWKWNYVAPMASVHMDLTNLLWGYNPQRHWAVGAFAGVGANIGFDNSEARSVNNANRFNDTDILGNIWSGTKTRFVGQLGVSVDYIINHNWAVGLELQANTLNDNYNSKKAGNADWYFNGLVGVKYTFGKQKKRVIPVVAPVPCTTDTVYVDRVVEKVVEKRVEVPAAAPVVETLRRDVFFTISNTQVSSSERSKVKEVAEFMKAHPEAKVQITGYADKGTGNKALNLRLAARRADTVTKELINKYGIAASRIITKSMGDDEYQPFADPVQNRVAICVVE